MMSAPGGNAFITDNYLMISFFNYIDSSKSDAVSSLIGSEAESGDNDVVIAMLSVANS